MTKPKILSYIALTIILFLSACSSVTRVEQPLQTEYIELQNPNTIGQTFVARFDGLDGINLYLKPKENNIGEIILHIKTGPQASQDIGISKINIKEIEDPGYYQFKFSPINNSSQEYYIYIWNPGRGQQFKPVSPRLLPI